MASIPVTRPTSASTAVSGITEDMRERWRSQRLALRRADRAILLGSGVRSSEAEIDWHDELLDNEASMDSGSSSDNESAVVRKSPDSPRTFQPVSTLATNTSSRTTTKSRSRPAQTQGSDKPSPCVSHALLKDRYKQWANERQTALMVYSRVTARDIPSAGEIASPMSSTNITNDETNRSNIHRVEPEATIQSSTQSPIIASTRSQGASRARPHSALPLGQSRTQKLMDTSLTESPTESRPFQRTQKPAPVHDPTKPTRMPVTRPYSARVISTVANVRPKSGITRPMSSTAKRPKSALTTSVAKSTGHGDVPSEIEVDSEGEYNPKFALEQAAAAAAREYFPVKFDARLVRQHSNPREVQQELLALREGKITLDRFPHLLTLPERLAAASGSEGHTKTMRIRPGTAPVRRHDNTNNNASQSAYPNDATAAAPGVFTLLVRSTAALNSLSKPVDFDTTNGSRGRLFSEREMLPLPGYETKQKLSNAVLSAKSATLSRTTRLLASSQSLWDKVQAVLTDALGGRHPLRQFIALIHRLNELCNYLQRTTWQSDPSDTDPSPLVRSRGSDSLGSQDKRSAQTMNQRVTQRLRPKFIEAWTSGVRQVEENYLATTSESKDTDYTEPETNSHDNSERITAMRMICDILRNSCNELKELFAGQQVGGMALLNSHTLLEISSDRQNGHGNDVELALCRWLIAVAETILESSDQPKASIGRPDTIMQLDWPHIRAYLLKLRGRIRVSVVSRLERCLADPCSPGSSDGNSRFDPMTERRVLEIRQEVVTERSRTRISPAWTDLPKRCLFNGPMRLLAAELALVEYLLLSLADFDTSNQ